MSIPVLTQVYDEVRRLSIAGSVVAVGDFRLKKLLPPLEQAGVKAPVFAKVAQGVTRLIESTELTSAESLLELSTLVNAILHTQGETGLAGDFVSITTTDLGQQRTQASARVLKPLLEALSTTGSGRVEVIRDAHERGIFRDLRLIGPALAALDDPYPEIADFVAASVLPLYGTSILPELREKFDQKGRGGHLRRLKLMHHLDPAGSREFVEQALEDGSKEVKLMAIECLGSTPQDHSFLLQQLKAKARDIRAAVLKALGRSDADDAVKSLCTAVQGADLDLAVEPVQRSTNPQVLKCVLDEAQSRWRALLASKEKDKAKLGKQAERMLILLECLRNRTDAGTGEFLLQAFSGREKLSAVKSEPGGKDIELRLVSIMARGPKAAQATLVDAHAALPAEGLDEAFIAASRSRSPAEVFELFSPYLAAGIDDKKKKRDSAHARRESIVEVLTSSWRRTPYGTPYGYTPHHERDELVKGLDPRWLDLAVEQQHLPLVQVLARPGDAGTIRLLSQSFAEQMEKSKDGQSLAQVLQVMVNIQHPEAADALIAAIRKHYAASYTFGLHWLGHMIPDLPKDALSKFDALLPTLPEKLIDQLLDFVTQLKNKP